MEIVLLNDLSSTPSLLVVFSCEIDGGVNEVHSSTPAMNAVRGCSLPVRRVKGIEGSTSLGSLDFALPGFTPGRQGLLPGFMRLFSATEVSARAEVTSIIQRVQGQGNPSPLYSAVNHHCTSAQRFLS